MKNKINVHRLFILAAVEAWKNKTELSRSDWMKKFQAARRLRRLA